MSTKNVQIYHGDIIYSKSKTEFSVNPDSYLVVKEEKVKGIYPVIPEEYKEVPVTDYGRNLIIPAFSDLHIHASQFVQRGVGMDCLLFDWLNTYTFPQESNFKDPEYAKLIYDQVVQELLRHGTMHASLFTTIHYDASDYLFRAFEKHGMYGYIGKVNMDQNSPDFLCETTEDSLKETERFVYEHTGRTAGSHVKPILTPRFAPTCSHKMMEGLGKIAKKYQCGLQTHLSESREEVKFALEMFPEFESDAQIYEKYGMLEYGPSIFAHVIFPNEKDLEILKATGSMAVHCPDATVNITAGLMPAAAMWEQDINISLGSDIGGGHHAGIYHQIARTVQASKMKEFYEPEGNHRLTFQEAFYLGTVGGGSCFGKVGSFEPGYQFNALVLGNLEDKGFELTPEERLEKFCYAGDDRNILERFLDGKKVVLN